MFLLKQLLTLWHFEEKVRECVVLHIISLQHQGDLLTLESSLTKRI